MPEDAGKAEKRRKSGEIKGEKARKQERGNCLDLVTARLQLG
jgi:hypothetical protein